MHKHLLYTALGLMGLMGTLAIGVVNATTTISEPYGHIDYTLNENEPFEAKVITITDGTDTITILDRNLGAKKAGTGCDKNTNGGYCSYDETYGYHFQWGNNHGFKPGCDLSGSTYYCSDTIASRAVILQVDATTISYNPASQEFYNSGVFYKGYRNWLTDNSKVDLWGGSTGGTDTITSTSSLNGDNWKVDESTVTNRQGPCPRGWHVPSIGELNKLVSMMTGSNNSEKITQLHSDLYIPFAGFRNYGDASVFSMGYNAYLWSSSPGSASYPDSRSLYLRVDGFLNMENDYRANALSVRCFYDSYQPFTQSFTLTFDVSDDNGNTDAETGTVASGTAILLSTGDFIATKDGWTHLGWNTDASATGVLESITMTEDTTVYAIFSKDLTVNYATGAGVSTIQKESDSCSMYNTGTSCTLIVPDITEDEGYENGVWKKGNDTVNPGEDITLTSDGDTYTATASAKEFAIRFVDSNQQNVDVIYSGVYKSDTSNITYPSWTRDGYTISWDKPIPATMPLNGDTITASRTENKKPSGGSSGGGGGGGSSSSSCKNLPANAVANNSSKPSSNINYYYSTNTSKVCTFQCKSGYTRNEGKETCDKASDSQTTSGKKENEPETATGNKVEIQTGNKAEIQTGNVVDTPEQAPENDNSVQDTTTNNQKGQNNTQKGGAYSTEFQEAYEFAHEKGITTMPTIEKANMNGKLTRIAMAKMLSQYAMNVLGQKPDETINNKFNDVTDKQNSDYDDGVTLAYQLGIMGQNMPGNNFRPNDEVTRGEFVTALSRMLYNTSDGEYKSTPKYYIHHMEKMKEEGIVTKDDPAMKELRGYVMIMLMRSAK